MLVKTVQEIEKGKAPRIKQGENFTYAPMLNKEMSKIDFTKDINEIKNKVYGLNPIMGAYAMYDNKKIKFWKIEILDNNEASNILGKEITEKIENGEIIASNDKIGLYIKANGGIIKVIEIQGENAKRMNICDFLRGNKIEEGKIFFNIPQ